MWTQANRYRYDRSKLRYPSDLTDEEWSQVAPLIGSSTFQMDWKKSPRGAASK